MVCVLTLAFPAGALAQSAGDNQYQDPFSGQTQGSQGGGGGNSGGGGGGGGNAGAGAGTQATQQTAQSSQSNQAQATADGQAQASQGATLPRTGFDAWLPLGYGLVLLLAGAAMRRAAGAATRTR